jgi:hypothetical protein
MVTYLHHIYCKAKNIDSRRSSVILLDQGSLFVVENGKGKKYFVEWWNKEMILPFSYTFSSILFSWHEYGRGMAIFSLQLCSMFWAQALFPSLFFFYSHAFPPFFYFSFCQEFFSRRRKHSLM